MTKQATRVWTALVLASALTIEPVSAQKQPKGWPGSGTDSAKTAKTVPAAKPAPAVTKAVAVMPVTSKARAAVTRPRPRALDPITAEVLSALHQQTELLKRLSLEIEAQRSLVQEQQDKVHALELRAAMPAPAPMTAESGGTRLKVSGLFDRLGEGVNDGGKSEQKMWVNRGAPQPSFITGLRMNYTRKTFAGVIAPRHLFVTNLQTTW